MFISTLSRDYVPTSLNPDESEINFLELSYPLIERQLLIVLVMILAGKQNNLHKIHVVISDPMHFYCSLLKESERKKTISNNEKDAKISDLKKANKKFDDHVKKLTTEKTGLGDQLQKLQAEV